MRNAVPVRSFAPPGGRVALAGLLVGSAVLSGACAGPQVPKLPAAVTGATPWAAGVARRSVAPPNPVHLGGYNLCSMKKADCRVSVGVHDEPSATAIALADAGSRRIVVFVGVDSVGLLGMDARPAAAKAAAMLAAEDGIRLAPEAVLVGSSHAHTTPDTVGLWSPAPDYRDDAWVAFLAGRITEAVVGAVRDLADVELRRGESALGNWHGDLAASDHRVFTLEGRTPAGAPRFTLVRYAGHPTVYGPEQTAVSADWVGVMRRQLESERGGAVAFVNGSLASVYPVESSECAAQDPFPDGVKVPEVSATQHLKTRCTGLAVAAAAATALAAAVPVGAQGLEVRHARFDVRLENLQLLLAAQAGILPVPEETDLDTSPPRLATAVTLVRLGDVDFVALGGEPSPSFSAACAARLTAAGRGNVVVLGMINDWLGYLLTREQWSEEEFEYHTTISPGESLLDDALRAVDAALASAPVEG